MVDIERRQRGAQAVCVTTTRLEDAGTAFTDVRDLMFDRMEDLSPEARQLSAVASVFGATFSIDDAGEVLGEPVGRLLPWVREIVEAGIVVAEEQAFAFVDDATREAIYARIPEPVRLPLHRQIGSLFLERGGSAPPPAGHLAGAARPGGRAAPSGPRPGTPRGPPRPPPPPARVAPPP